MNMMKKGDWIRNTYRVLQAFPFVQGALYYAEVSPADGGKGGGTTRFLHALDLRSVSRGARPDALLKRDRSSFFPLQGLFVEEGILYQVFGRLDGNLMAHHLYRTVPLSLAEAVHILKAVSGHLVRMYERGEFTVIHPQNMVLTGETVRFLYGGPTGMLPKRGGAGQLPAPAGDRRREEALDAYSLGALAYIMLTGASPAPGGRVTPIRSYRRDVPGELEHFVMRSLTADPATRPRVADLWGWVQTVRDSADFVKKKDDPVHWLKADREGLEAYLFRFPEPGEESAAEPLDPAEWEGWEAGFPDVPPQGEVEMDPVRPPEGERVWTKAGGAETAGAPPGPGESAPGRGRSLRKRKPLLAAAAVLLLLGAGTGAYLLTGGSLFADDAEDAARYYGESVKSVRENRMGEAIAQAKLAVEADPAEEEYLLHLANLYGEKKQYDRSVQILTQGVKEAPRAKVYDTLSVYLLLAGEPDEARDAVEKALALEPGNPLFHYHRGKVYGARENDDAAAQALEKAVRLDPDNPRYHGTLSSYLLRTGDIGGAQSHAEKAAELEPKNPDHWLKAGQAYLADRERVYEEGGASKKNRARMAKRTEAAIRAFHQSTSLDPGNAPAYYYLSIAHYFYGSYSSSEKSARESVRLAPETAAHRYQHGVVLQRLGKEKEAGQAYQKAVELDPGNARYQKALEQSR